MDLLTAEQMQKVDTHAIDIVGVSASALMETAGRAVAARAMELVPKQAPVLVLAGKGNNGGDGFVAARTLHEAGLDVRVLLAFESDPTKGPAAANLRAARESGVVVDRWNPTHSLELPGWGPPALCIDALLGVGARGAPRPPLDEIIRSANALKCPILAIDVPSGLDSTTGQVPGECVQAHSTVTFSAGKIGLYSDPGSRFVGEVTVVDSGHPRVSLDIVSSRSRLIDPQLASAWLPARPTWGNKGTFGTVLVVAGSAGMMGAAALCSRAALRSGAGLVRLIVPESVAALANTLTLEVICRAVPEAPGGHLGVPSLDEILEAAKDARVAAIGPGLSTSTDSADLVSALVPSLRCPMVIDADALNLLARNPDPLHRRSAPAVLTPHPGEMGRLLGLTTAEVQSDRIGAVTRLARQHDVIAVLKGMSTLIASPAGDLLISPGGCPAMATAGAGDVLTGVIASLLAQGLDPFLAAGLGVYLHARAGALWSQVHGRAGLLASELCSLLPDARSQIS